MKKITTTIKTMFLVTIVLVMAQGCIPTTPTGGGINPSNTFNFNVNDHCLSSSDAIHKNIISLDGDSIMIGLIYIATFGSAENFQIYSKSSDGNIYEFLTSDTDITTAIRLAAGVYISDTLSSYHWETAKDLNINATYSNIIPDFERFDKHFGFSENGNVLSVPTTPIFSKIPLNEDRFIVFRKIKNIGYQYYWLRIKYTNSPLLSGMPDGGVNCTRTHEFNILNGKFQVNNITTGQ